MIYLETERLILRNFRQEDAEDLFQYLSLESTALHEDFEPFTKAQCESAALQWGSDDCQWAVELKAENKLIGNINHSPELYDAYEIGYDFNPLYGKQGYATESCGTLVHYIFTHLKGRRVVAGCNEGNVASQRLLERLGFRKEGLFLEDVAFKRDGEGNPIYVSSIYYGMLRREWEAHK